MSRSNVLLAGAIVFALAIGVLIGRFALPQGGLSLPPLSREAGEQGRSVREPFQELRGEGARRPGPAVAEGFAFSRLNFDMSGDSPRACFVFTEKLDDSGKTNYGDYIRISPSVKPAVEVNGQNLCVSGLAFDVDYTATLKKGLPGAKGQALERPQEIAIAFGDKPAYVGFAGDGVILPRLEADGVGIETVNVSKFEIDVRRVSDRSLARKAMVKGESVSPEDYLYVYGEEDGEDVGVKVFNGKIDVKADRNETKTTVFALGAALKDLKPGAYFVRLKDVSEGADKYSPAQAWRWILFTDIALSSYSSPQGIDVFARAISNGKPLAGVELSLIAANNDVLASARTDADGRARFGEAAINGEFPLTPRMIMAYGANQDFAALDLNRTPLDLSDRNVQGRAAPAKLDAFVYLDRGIYRPGETVRIAGLLRDGAGRAVADRPVTVTVRRPNYTEAEKIRVEKTDIGGFTHDFDIPRSAARGAWTITVEADGAGAVGSETFSVEDFVPQRLEVTLDVDEKEAMLPDEPRPVMVKSRFLYGAPASGLGVEAEARLRLDPNPFPDFSAYRYGPADGKFDERFIQLPNTTLDDNGEATIELTIDDGPLGLGAPLRADLVVGVIEPGGRVVRESARVPVRWDERYVGLKLSGDGYGFGENEPVEVNAILVSRDGALVADDLEWRLVEEDYWFDWYRENGEWRWRRSFKDILIGEGKVAASAAGAVSIRQKLDPGDYRLTVTDPQTGAQTDILFYVGWRSYAAGVETPDQAALSAPVDPPAPGGQVKLMLKPPYEGEAIVAVATDRVHAIQRHKVPKDGKEIIIDTDPSWGAGFYVLATVVTPRDVVNRPIPRRAMGVAYVPFDMSARKLAVEVGASPLVRPRQNIVMPVKIGGAARGEKVMLTLAAVDEGILRLTKFASPDPVDYYYGKKALGVEVRDDYGRILHANLGAPARFGGDQIGGEGLTVVPTKSVALYSGLVTVGGDGVANVPVEIPDFNGELRLMAVAWSGDKLGSASQPLTVRDPVPAELAMPRFLAPGDTASATLLIDNVDGAAGDYKVTLRGGSPISVSETKTFSLAKGKKATERFTFAAGEIGIGSVSLDVEGPGGFKVSRSYPIQVRTPFFPVTNVSTVSLAPGASFLANAALVEPFVSGSAEVTVSFSRIKGVEPGPLLDSLYRYPYGCSEQLTSSAMPLLFVDVLGGEAGRGPERAVRPRIQKAVNELLERQSADGAFGLWREGDGWATPWLGAYVTDFLYRAKAQNYAVPDEALDRSYQALAQVARVDKWVSAAYDLNAQVGAWSNDTNEHLRRRSAAYALYVLGRAGKADLADLRYFHDALLKGTPDPLARAQIAGALAAMGDRARSISAFEMAVEALGYDNTGDYYQTPLRDAAGVLALAAEADQAQLVDQLTDDFSQRMRDPESLHTQEKAFVLLASQALLKRAGPLALSIGGVKPKDLKPAPSFTPSLAEIQKGVSYKNESTGAIFRTVMVSGAPKSAPPPASQGFTIEKRFATRDGRAADLAAVKQNDRLVVVLSGAPQAERTHPAIIADLLPAGFEIETLLNPEDGAANSGPYAWIGDISRPRIAEARDDRYVAAVDLSNRERFTLAYVVRAVTPGSFMVPGAVVEDMYKPGVVGRSAPAKLIVAPSQ
jgi:hypothetical protein